MNSEANKDNAQVQPDSKAQDQDNQHPADLKSLDQLDAELDVYTKQISTQVRTLTYGTLGLTWLLLLKSQEVSALSDQVHDPSLYVIAILCILTLLIDFLQLALGKYIVDRAHDEASSSPTRTGIYNDQSLAYRAQGWCFIGKQVLTALSTLSLIVVIGAALILWTA